MMKTLFILLFGAMCLNASAQQSIYVRLKPDGFYSKDSLGITHLTPKTPKDYFKITPYLTKTGFIAAKYNDTLVYLDTAQIKHGVNYNEFISVLWHKTHPYNPYDLKVKIDSVNKSAYYQEVVKIDTSISISQLKDRMKQYIANNIIATGTQLEDNRIVYTTVQNLYIPQGLGSMEFEVRYTMTIDLKQGKYRYTVNNIEMGYITLMVRHGKRETLYSEYHACNDGNSYDNHLKRIISFENHLKGITDNLKMVLTQNSRITKSDF